MSQALHTSATGINSGQSQINVIANNVANINTTAFKAANLTFETLYSNTLSHGSQASKNGGGTNPKQIGLGVKIGGITRNFAPGSFSQTGRALDCMISGTGFFVVQDSAGKQYYTRDGIFSVDSAGNLVTQNGMKVVSAKSTYSNASSDLTVKLPKNLKVIEFGDPTIAVKTIEQLNNASITEGVVAAYVQDDNNPSGTHKVEFRVPSSEHTVQELVDSFNSALSGVEERTETRTRDKLDVNGDKIPLYEADGVTPQIDGDGNPLYETEEYEVTVQVPWTCSSVRFSCNNGKISYIGNVDFDTTDASTTTSNFLAETGLSDTRRESERISVAVNIQDIANYNDSRAVALSDAAIDENGFLVASYSDGSVLTQYVDGAGTIQWKYTTNEGIVVVGDDVTAASASLLDRSFCIELATMVNEEGLVSINNNLWEWGPDTGEIYYGMAGEMCFGQLETGGFEGSNVDIATELSNMIMAQRMIQMNSRVFNTASSVMETLAYLGQ